MRILIVEDAPRIASFLVHGLTEDGHVTRVARDLDSAEHALAGQRFDAIVLDRSLPDGDGLDLVRRLRRSGDPTPVLCLTARDSIPERVEGLRSGADDYLVKPFAYDELLARLERLGRGVDSPEVLEVGPLSIDVTGHRVTRGGVSVDLTAREFALLLALARGRGRVMTRTRLLEQVWGSRHDPQTNVLDVYIRYLRQKLGDGLIRTVRGVGYSLEPEDT